MWSYCVSVMCPGAKLHSAQLLVKREVLHVNFAAGLVDGWWVPQHLASVVEHCLGHDGHLIVAIRTVQGENINL